MAGIPVAASALAYPFEYSRSERSGLGSLLDCVSDDPGGELAAWARGFVRTRPTDTLSLLKDISSNIFSQIAYESRVEEGTQLPLHTLARGRGSCRDFAALPAGEAGSTHAWADIYVPGAGWITFDPTHQRVGSAHLVPVAVGRDVTHVMPISGTFAGAADARAAMDVNVIVTVGMASTSP